MTARDPRGGYPSRDEPLTSLPKAPNYGKSAYVPFRPVPELIDHIDGSPRMIRRYRRAARKLLAEAKLSDLCNALANLHNNSAQAYNADGKRYLLLNPEDLRALVEEYRKP